MHLIEYSNYEIKPTDECFLIKPFRDLFHADRTKNKDKFMQQLSVVYFLVDPRSSYNYILNEDERLKEIIAQEGLPKDFKIDGKLAEAIEIYKKHIITSSYLLLQDTKIAVNNVRTFLRNVDLTAVDDKGKPVYTIQSVTSAIKQIPQLAKDLVEAERMITKEIAEQGRARGGNDAKSLFDDGIKLD